MIVVIISVKVVMNNVPNFIVSFRGVFLNWVGCQFCGSPKVCGVGLLALVEGAFVGFATIKVKVAFMKHFDCDWVR